MKDKVSIVTVCYNAEKFIKRTMDSVIGQTYRPLEYIIVDGASTDMTNTLIEGYKERIEAAGIELVYTSEPDKGIYDAMNKGIKLASGEWINFMNADDVFASHDVVQTAFAQELDCDVLYGDVLHKGEDGTEEYIGALNASKLLTGMPFSHQATFTKAELLKEKWFDTTYRIAADYKFFLQMFLEGKRFVYMPEVFAIFSLASYTIAYAKRGEREAMRAHEECGVKQYSAISKLLRVQRIVLKLIFKRLIPKKILKKRRERRRKQMMPDEVQFKNS